MASAFGNLSGSGNQQVWLNFYYISYNQAGNYSTWGYELRYYGNGWGSWSGSTWWWSLSGFAVSSGGFNIPYGERYNTYKTLTAGTFTRAHDANGYLAAGNLVGAISTDHSSVGNGTVAVYSGAPPRIPKVPAQPAAPTFQSASTTTINFGITAPNNNGSTITTYNLQASTSANFSTGLVSWNSGASNQVTPPLVPGNKYWIRYRAVNGVGTGPWSPALSASTLPATPPGILGLSTIPGNGADITLTPPSGSTGVTKYTVERRKLGTTSPVTSTDTPTSPLRVNGLTPGESYQYRASAWFNAYQSPWSDWITVVQSNPNTDAGAYFDGSTPDTPAVDYSWLGAVNNSRSVGTAMRPMGWRSFEESSILSGGTGAVFRASGGFQGSFAARLLFFSDATASNLFFGTSISDPMEMAEVEEGATYFGSIYAWPSRTQSLRAYIHWVNDAGVMFDNSAGELAPVPGGQFTRLTVSGVAPAGAVRASIVVSDQAGVNWSIWKSGEWLHLDAAMITLQDLYPYFDGNTADTNLYRYDWLGVENASVSSRTTLQQSELDPLLDPDCPPPPKAPAAPQIIDNCIDEVGSWRRYWAVIPSTEISDWGAMLPTVRVTTGGVNARQVRVRIYQNPEELTPEAFTPSVWDSEQIISYMPALTTLTLDGVEQRVFAEVNGAAPIAADKLLFGTGGTPATWPTLSCGIGYLLSFDVPLDAPVGNVSVGIDLTRRM